MNISAQSIRRVYPNNSEEQKEFLFLNEHRLLIRVNGKNWSSLVCTETNLMELVAGHLLSSGLIEKKDDILEIHFCETKQKADVSLRDEILWEEKEKNTASCCPKNEHFFESQDTVPLEKLPDIPCKSEWIFSLADSFAKESALHKYTAGTHSCILAKGGKPVFSAEDIGRHTALDKALGYMLLNDMPPQQVMLFTSGRVPVDMVEKVIRAKVGILVSKSVPTTESIALAKQYGLKLFFRAWSDSYDAI
ncbi:MAG: formate dehydrogenase accessory sulfurtransferase FdhD [Treponema sp.]|nr:formate dehydrogenase accessory sulfurtransferase FdhD [Treponema sp.]